MRKVTALLLAALVLVGANTALADKTITLDKDTKLVPQGWTIIIMWSGVRRFSRRASSTIRIARGW